jgi:chromosome partitioning protein
MNVISISNQKGGVGKTTTAVNLAYEMSRLGHKTLLIDFDPQSNASSGLGVPSVEGELDLYDVFFDQVKLSEIIRPTSFNNLWVAPGSKDLISIEVELGKTPGRELILKSQLALLVDRFDVAIIDCPPSSGLLTLNSMGASKWLLIPLQAEYYALEGISSLLSTVSFVQQTFNPGLEILGVAITMFDARTNLGVQVIDDAKGYFGSKVFETKVPRNIKLAESPSHSLPIGIYAPDSVGARAYRELCAEVVAAIGKANEGLVVNS